MMDARTELGGVYKPGNTLSNPMREEILNLYNQGFQTSEISLNLKITDLTVRKIQAHFRSYGTVLPFATGGSQVSCVVRDDILQVIEMWKLQKPSIYTAEIRTRLLLEGICALDDISSIDAINKRTRRIGMTRKILFSINSSRIRVQHR